MSVSSILNALQQGAANNSNTLTVLTDGGFGNTLNMGQILKGKVLRHYEGNRYGVEFGGQEKIVDSVIPLRTNEILYGRVVGLGDKVHLRQVPSAVLKQDVEIQSKPNSVSQHPLEQQLSELFNRYNASLGSKDKANLLMLAKNASNPLTINLSGLILKKLGITFSPELLKALQKHLDGLLRADKSGVRSAKDVALANGKNNLEIPTENENVSSLALALQKYLKEENAKKIISEHAPSEFEQLRDHDSLQNSKTDGDQSDQNQQSLLGKWLLNTQQGGAVSHKYITVPIWIGGKYIELNLAMYSQHKPKGQEFNHQRIVFSLLLDNLGHIDISAITTGRNLSINVAAENDAAIDSLSDYMNELKEILAEHDWQVDSIRYQVKTLKEENSVLKTVIEYQVTQDSLSNLF